jgi:hypothetical protein
MTRASRSATVYQRPRKPFAVQAAARGFQPYWLGSLWPLTVPQCCAVVALALRSGQSISRFHALLPALRVLAYAKSFLKKGRGDLWLRKSPLPPTKIFYSARAFQF